MKNHFFIPYAGNKRQEVEHIYDSIKDITKYNTIIEPFCGSCAISYYISLQHPKKFKYVLNDNNQFIIELLNIAKDENKLNELIEKLNKLVIDIDKTKYNEIIKNNNLESFIIKNKIYSIRPGLFPLNKNIISDFSFMNTCPIINFLRTENIEIRNQEAVEIYEEFSNNKKHIVFLDPPYLMSCNDFYLNKDVNVYEYLVTNKIEKNKSYIILILEKNWIIELLFNNKKYKIIEYDKKYEITKKKTTHIIITNK